MRFKKLSIITLILMSVLLASCSSLTTSEDTMDMPDVKVEKGNQGNEVVFDDAKTENKGGFVSTYGKSPDGYSTTTPDGSTIDTMYDAAGNKIEVRYFNNHPNIKSVNVTFGKKGNEVIVFGHNREFKKLSSEMAEKVLSMTGTEIANLAGIHSVEKSRSKRSMDGKAPQQPKPTITYQKPGYQYPTPVQPQPQPQEVKVENQTTPDNQTVNQNPTIAWKNNEGEN